MNGTKEVLNGYAGVGCWRGASRRVGAARGAGAHYHAMRYCNMKSLCDRFVAEDEQGIEAEVVAAKDTKTSAATSFDAAAGLAALTKHGIGLVTAHTLPNRRMVRKGGAGLQIRCVIGK